MMVTLGAFTLTQTIMPNANVIKSAEALPPGVISYPLPCPSHYVWLDYDPLNPGKCEIKCEMCIVTTQIYYLRYDEADLNGWSYILMDLNQLNEYCVPSCHYYTCAKRDINCEAYVWEIGYFNEYEVWVKIYDGTVPVPDPTPTP